MSEVLLCSLVLTGLPLERQEGALAGRVKGAGKELSVVRKSEKTMLALIATQDSVYTP